LTLSKRDGGYTAQYQAQPDLWYISQPPGSGATDGLGTYVYDSTGGRNVVVYILDLGAFRMSLPVSTQLCLLILIGGSVLTSGRNYRPLAQ
jgi:hypothetical protein